MPRDDDDDLEVVVLRGSAARRFLSGEEEDSDDELPEGWEMDDDGYLFKAKAPPKRRPSSNGAKRAPAKKAGGFASNFFQTK
jgi:hypothetical protein